MLCLSSAVQHIFVVEMSPTLSSHEQAPHPAFGACSPGIRISVITYNDQLTLQPMAFQPWSCGISATINWHYSQWHYSHYLNGQWHCSQFHYSQRVALKPVKFKPVHEELHKFHASPSSQLHGVFLFFFIARSNGSRNPVCRPLCNDWPRHEQQEQRKTHTNKPTQKTNTKNKQTNPCK